VSSFVLITTDIHIHDKWFDRSAKFFDFLKEVIQEYKPIHFFHLGDLFENKDYISNQCKKLVIDFLKFLASQKIYSSFLVGNHDVARWEDAGPVTTTYFISGYDYATEIRAPVIVNIDSKNILFLPYLPQYYPFDYILEHLPLNRNEKIDYICVHGDIRGYAYPSGFVSKEGWDLDEFQYRIKVLIGHYHLPNIERGILGAPYMRDFRDALPHSQSCEFGVYLVDFSKSKFSYEFIPFESDYYVKMTARNLSDFKKKFSVLKRNYKDKPIRLWIKQQEYFDIDKEVLRQSLNLKDLLVTGDFELSDKEVDQEHQQDVFFNKEILQQIIQNKIPKEYRNNPKFLELGHQLFVDLGLSLKLDK